MLQQGVEFVDHLKASLHTLLSSLPRKVRDPDEDEKLASLQFIHNHMLTFLPATHTLYDDVETIINLILTVP